MEESGQQPQEVTCCLIVYPYNLTLKEEEEEIGRREQRTASQTLTDVMEDILILANALNVLLFPENLALIPLWSMVLK